MYRLPNAILYCVACNRFYAKHRFADGQKWTTHLRTSLWQTLIFRHTIHQPIFFSPFHVRLLRETDNPTIRSVNNWATRNSRNSVLGVMISQVRLNWWFVYLTYRSWKQPVFGKLSYVRPSEMFSFNYLILIYTFHSLVCTYYQSSLLLSFS